MKIRLLQKKDVKACAAIVGKNYNKKEERSAALELRDMFGSGQCAPTYFVAEEKGKILGFAGIGPSWMDYSVWNIFWVNVVPGEQKRGIGKQLVARSIREIKKRKDARLILLSARIPEYYKRHFDFKTIDLIAGEHQLMSLSINKAVNV